MTHDEWIFNFDVAPDGYYETSSYKVKGETRTKKVFVPCKVLVSHHHTENVSITWKLEDGRWNGYMKDQEPLAWMHLPQSARGTK